MASRNRSEHGESELGCWEENMNMRTSVIKVAALIGALCVVASIALAFPATETVTDKVIDLFCYDPATGANTGMDHKAIGSAAQEGRECAWACAKWEGQPVGLLTPDGKVYQLASGVVSDNNSKIAPHMTHTVTITGEVAESHGIMMLTANDFKMVSK
jgi:hypothetical protein